MDNRPPLPGGDQLFIQRNMEQLEMLDGDGEPQGGGGNPAGGDQQGG